VNGIDILLHNAILQSIQKEIDGKRFQDMEQSLQAHGIKLSDLVNKFGEVRKPLFEFEEELKRIEDAVFREFLIIEKGHGGTWLTIKNRHLTESILKTFADEDKKLLLNFTRTKPETIPRILASCNLPNTSGYRKMRQLIDDGFVIPTGLIETVEGRRTMLYKSIIQKIQIIIDKDEIHAKISVPKEVINSNGIIKMLVEVGQGKRIMAN
jgi:hypothetical protein